MKLFRKIDWKNSKSLIVSGIVAIALIGLDLLSKWLVEIFVQADNPIAIIPNFLYVSKSYNVAIAFSFGSNLPIQVGRSINIIISLVMSVVIIWYWLLNDPKLKTSQRICAMLLASGAVGNLIDRAFYWVPVTGFDGVIDFIQFYFGGGPSKGNFFLNPFATFNFADAYLTIGIIWLLIIMIVDSIKDSKKNKGLSEDPRLKVSKGNETIISNQKKEESLSKDGNENN